MDNVTRHYLYIKAKLQWYIVQTCSNSAISRKCELSASQLYYYDNAAMHADFAVDNLIRYEGLVAAPNVVK